MTSSLVGSEMCIRDSLKRDPPTSSVASGVLNKTTAPQKGKHNTTEEAVSYTHLTLPTICSV
eukprot:11088673-Prorocentrum_lima.AAC.1